MTTYHFIKEDLEKAEAHVKPFMRVKRGKLEHVKAHTRHVIGQPVSVQEQSEWIKKQKKLLEDIKYAFQHGDFDYLEANHELMKEFSMSAKEATTYVDQWKAELKAQSNEQLKEEIKQKFIEGAGFDKTIDELVNKGVIATEAEAIQLVGKWHENFIDAVHDKMLVNKETFNNKIDLLSESVTNLSQDKINALVQIKNDLLANKLDTYAAITRVNLITGWWLEANTLLVFSWQQNSKEVKEPISLSIPPPPQELVEEIKFPPNIILGISNATLEKWATLTDSQKKEIEKIKKQFFYYKLNKTNALSRLVYITGIGKPGDKQGIEDLDKIITEWGKDKYKYSKEKAKYSKGKKEKGFVETPFHPAEENITYEGTPEGVEKFKKESGLIGAETPKQPINAPKVSQTVLPENLESTGEGQKGSNPGGVYKDKITGTKYYIKAYPDKQGVDSGAAQARVEALSNKIYNHLGITTPQTDLVFMKDFNKLAIASKWIDEAQTIPIEEQAKNNDVLKGFVVDAYLKNWDVAGLNYENIIRDSTGQIIRMDNGGTMMFRAQGSSKEFEPNAIPELDTLKNPQHGAGKVFKGVTEDFIKAQAQYLVSNLKEADIERFIDESGLTGTVRQKAFLGLTGRRQYLIDKYGLTVPMEEQTVFALYEGGTTAMKEGFTAIGTHHSAVKGKLLDTHLVFPGFESLNFYVYKNAKGEYGVAEVITGLNASGSFKTEQEAINDTKEKLLKHGLEYTKKQIDSFEYKAPQIPQESQLKVWDVPEYKLPTGKVLKPNNWIKFGHANPKNNYKVTKIYANNKVHVEEQDSWGNKVQEYDMTITDDIILTTEPKVKEKTPPPSPKVDEKVLERITFTWNKAKEIAHTYDSQSAVPKLKEFNSTLRKTFEETPYVFRAVTDTSFHKSMDQVLNDHVLTGSSHVQGTTCCSISPWSSLGFGSYMFVLDKKKLVENADWVKPIQYYNSYLQQKEPGTFQGKSSEHADIYSASYVSEMEVRAKHIHDPLSVIAEVWIHRENASEQDKWKIIEDVENKYPQLIGRVRVLNIYKDLKWPKGMAKSLRRYLEGLKKSLLK